MSLVKYDLVIVGGGPAGLSAAYASAKGKVSTVVLEKDDSIGQYVRTSGVTWINDMERLGIPSTFYNPIKNYRLISPSNEIIITGKEPRACVLDVRATYQYLATLAANEGSDLMVRSHVYDVNKSSSRILGVKARTPHGNLEIDSKVVIDASGFNSIVARKAGLVNEWRRYGIGVEYECFCEYIDPTTWILMVGSKYSEAGYSWLFPLSENRFRIGVGIGRPESILDPMKKLNEILENKIAPLKEIKKIQPLEVHFGLIPNEGVSRSTVYDGLILVGDSAGQSNPLVLEGIRFAIDFGRLAGEIGAKSLQYGSDKKSLLEYEKIWRSRSESKIKASLKVQSRWLHLTDEQWDNEIEILRDLSIDEFLDFVRCEFTNRKMLRLAMNHPKLVARRLFELVVNK